MAARPELFKAQGLQPVWVKASGQCFLEPGACAFGRELRGGGVEMLTANAREGIDRSRDGVQPSPYRAGAEC